VRRRFAPTDLKAIRYALFRAGFRVKLNSMRVSRFLLVSILFAVTLLSGAAWGQLVPSPDAPPVSTAPPPPPEEESMGTLKLNVNLVDLFFTVKNKSGELVPHLTKDDCSVEEDKVPQTLKNFTAETHLPLTLGMMLDTSGSQIDVLPLEQQAGSEFLQRVLKSKDQAFLVSFDVNVDLLQDFTNSARMLSHALDKAEINTAAGNGGSGIPGLGGGTIPIHGTPKGTLLYDAIYQASNDKMADQNGRKALIILTDGDDQGSDHKIQEAIAAAQKSNTIVYVILIAEPSFYGGFGYSGYSAAKKISDETGGRLINVGTNGKKLDAAFQQIEEELRTEYLASYVPTNAKLDGRFRRIAVQCKGDDMKVQVRKGYYAPSAEAR
jgi:VWFA-related protein